MKKGQLSVFFTLVMMVILSLVLTCIEGARISSIRMQTECVMDMGLDSVFAEYHRELLEQYDLFFIDSSYGASAPSYYNTEEHLKGYMEYNFDATMDISAFGVRDFYDISIDNVCFTQATLATDWEGEILKQQAISYMRNKVGVEFIDDIQGKLQIVEDNELDTRDIKEERTRVEEEISDFTIDPIEVSENEWIEVELNNPADDINTSRNKGILNVVLEEGNNLSPIAINSANYVSNRTLNKGIGIDKNLEEPFSTTDEIMYVEYLMDKLGNYTNQKENGELKYQLEYILAGENSDIQNLKWVVNRLILLREVANVTYLFSDAHKVAEADTLAWSLTAVSLTPYLQPLVKSSILFAWAYAESVYDVKTLLSGGNVPLLKTNDSWHFTLTNMLDYENHINDSEENKKGLNYEMYLRILLCLENSKDKVQRSMDIMEMDIRKTEGNINFRLDGCIATITSKMNVSSGFGYYFEIKRYYSY